MIKLQYALAVLVLPTNCFASEYSLNHNAMSYQYCYPSDIDYTAFNVCTKTSASFKMLTSADALNEVSLSEISANVVYNNVTVGLSYKLKNSKAVRTITLN